MMVGAYFSQDYGMNVRVSSESDSRGGFLNACRVGIKICTANCFSPCIRIVIAWLSELVQKRGFLFLCLGEYCGGTVRYTVVILDWELQNVLEVAEMGSWRE